MTKTLTTERLREIAERRSPSLRWGEAEQIAAELLANREAQPMAWSTVFGDKRAVTVHAETAEVWNSDGLQVQSLFTAPPASVVNPEFTGAAAVPDFKALAENLVENLVDCGGADEEAVGQYLAFAEKACRAAMLAQPVSQGKLNSPEIPDGCQWTYDERDYKWDSACGEAWMFSDGGPTENGVKFCQSCGKPVLLAAAPEGGNG